MSRFYFFQNNDKSGRLWKLVHPKARNKPKLSIPNGIEFSTILKNSTVILSCQTCQFKTKLPSRKLQNDLKRRLYRVYLMLIGSLKAAIGEFIMVLFPIIYVHSMRSDIPNH
ncbi:hypothetical protein RF11_14298 [Thelohanellus kitauei]|uniref:Uncharacterized protein n=1 Tax=Thelohanellus kitauei TaxID=669202 RepID=A0A0C2MTR0_THEKT|nr:hypothetical protein RF11_14298 [Thelohanellus kitauei]